MWEKVYVLWNQGELGKVDAWSVCMSGFPESTVVCLWKGVYMGTYSLGHRGEWMPLRAKEGRSKVGGRRKL